MPITISINSGADFEPVSEGVHQATLVEIVDKGIEQTVFGPTHPVELVWRLKDSSAVVRQKTKFAKLTKTLAIGVKKRLVIQQHGTAPKVLCCL